MDVLDRLNSGRFLRHLVFYGGTMLRLCHGLDRYSVDLDFRLRAGEPGVLFRALSSFLATTYMIRDAANKYHSLLFELREPDRPRSLKIEIRKSARPLETEQSIAYSPHSERQVLLRTATLQEMMRMKAHALQDRGEIRDAYDMEFLVKRGVPPPEDPALSKSLLDRIRAFTKADYSVKLGSVLEPEKRAYYREHGFRILEAALQNVLSGSRTP